MCFPSHWVVARHSFAWNPISSPLLGSFPSQALRAPSPRWGPAVCSDGTIYGSAPGTANDFVAPDDERMVDWSGRVQESLDALGTGEDRSAPIPGRI